jgi:hypothetical protein
MMIPNQIVISSTAYLSMKIEAHAFPERETGGIFLGRRVGQTWYIIETIDPGYKKIVRNHAFFEYDAEYVTHLANIRSRLYQEGLKLIGLWHRHPGSFDSFSSTDDATNQRYATQHGNGALSAIVNLDPDFRLTVYHVSMPLQYQRIDLVTTGDDHIPAHLRSLKHPDDHGRLIATDYNAASPSSLTPSDEQALLLEMLESEMEHYLDQQKVYEMDLKMIDEEINLQLQAVDKEEGIPEKVIVRFMLENGEQICEIGGHRYPYRVGIVEEYVAWQGKPSPDSTDTRDDVDDEDTMINGYCRELNLSRSFDLSQLRIAYRTQMKNYHPDNWQREQCQELSMAATKKAQKIQHAYEYLVKHWKEKNDK